MLTWRKKQEVFSKADADLKAARDICSGSAKLLDEIRQDLDKVLTPDNIPAGSQKAGSGALAATTQAQK